MLIYILQIVYRSFVSHVLFVTFSNVSIKTWLKIYCYIVMHTSQYGLLFKLIFNATLKRNFWYRIFINKNNLMSTCPAEATFISSWHFFFFLYLSTLHASLGTNTGRPESAQMSGMTHQTHDKPIVLIFLNRITFRDQKKQNFQYPSITVCPEKTFKSPKSIPESGTFENVKKFYLENVRSLHEVFFFVNQRTWSRDGHRCMTGKVSEDPGRPCIFPLTFDNVSYTKCVMPSTWVTVLYLSELKYAK